MRQILLIFSLFCASYLTVNAQTNTWTGAGANDNWNNVDNWSLKALPSSNNDVIIPTGFTVNINVAAITKSIVVQGTTALTISNNLSFLNASSFAKNVTVNWSSASFIGGGNLTNNGTINMVSGGNRYISGGTTLTNNGLVNMLGTGYFFLYDTSVFNNTANGVFDLQSDAYINYNGTSHHFINSGILKKTGGTAVSYIYPILTNTGTISVESGTIDMYYHGKTFDGGIYNVSSNAALVVSTKGMVVKGTLTGTLDGPLNWIGDISVPTTATFDFKGKTGVTWSSGSLIGGGNLTNASHISLTTNNNRYISGETTMTNKGTVVMPGSGSFFLYDSSTFHNTTSGIFDLQSDAYISYNGTSHHFLNAGMLKKTGGTGVSYIYPILTNTGTISVESGTIDMYYHRKTFDGGVYNVSSEAVLVVSTKGMVVKGTLTGTLEGPLNWVGDISVPTTATFNFTGKSGVTWTAGSLIGGGNLTNESSIKLSANNNRYISGGTTLTNNGIVAMPSAGSLFLYDASIFNNTTSGVFDIQSDAYISYNGTAHHFINAGVFKKTGGEAISYIHSIFTNTGTISVESGTIDMYYHGKTFDGGVYNVSSGSALVLSTTGMVVSGTLTGVLDGALNWTGNISVPNAATFDFTGKTGVTWTSGSLIGGGTLTNASSISFTTNNNRYISGQDTKLINTGMMLFPSTGSLYLYNNVTLDNQASGIIDLQSDANIGYNGNGGLKILNSGLITKTGGARVAYIYPPVTNSGTIDVSSGKLTFTDNFGLTNTKDGIIKGTANITIPSAARFTNDGTFAPGGSPGILTVLGDYKSSATSVLDVELNGLSQGQEYDLLAITGKNVVFDGGVNVNLGFKPKVNDEFIVATTSGTISTCKLATTTATEFDGMLYTFNVSCRNDKEVVLRLRSVVLGLDDFQLADSSIKLYPNPVKNRLIIKNTHNLNLENGQIIDLSGKVMTTYDLKEMGTTKEIPMENYATGLYFLKIKSTDGVITKRVVKE